MTDRAVGALLDAATMRLAEAGVEDARREARLLLGHATGRAGGLFAGGDLVPGPAAACFVALVERRAVRIPLAHLTGLREFWSLRLSVGPEVLIPRPDSETLVEAALALRPNRNSVRTILDLGTGSGALLLACLTEYPSAWGVGVDRSVAAVAVAAANAAKLGLGGRALLMAGDWAEPLAGRFDLVVSNPPYVESAAIPGLQPEVALHEPWSALDGGDDGMDAYRAILTSTPRLLAPGGLAVLELGAGQARCVAALAEAAGLVVVVLRADLAGVPRALCLETGKKPVGGPGGAD